MTGTLPSQPGGNPATAPALAALWPVAPQEPKITVRLHLVRHATHVDFGRRLTGRSPGVPLSPQGEAEAEALGRALRSQGLSEVQTSPRDRARATAEAISRASGAPLVVVEALDEIDFGEWTGAAFADLDGQPAWDEWNRARGTAHAPGGESMAEVAGRVARHAEALAASRTGERIALVTHADVIRALVVTCLGMPLDNLLRLEVSPASVSRIEAGPWGTTLLSLNETVQGGTLA